jgi:hypothetical protein
VGHDSYAPMISSQVTGHTGHRSQISSQVTQQGLKSGATVCHCGVTAGVCVWCTPPRLSVTEWFLGP